MGVGGLFPGGRPLRGFCGVCGAFSLSGWTAVSGLIAALMLLPLRRAIQLDSDLVSEWMRVALREALLRRSLAQECLRGGRRCYRKLFLGLHVVHASAIVELRFALVVSFYRSLFCPDNYLAQLTRLIIPGQRCNVTLNSGRQIRPSACPHSARSTHPQICTSTNRAGRSGRHALP